MKFISDLPVSSRSWLLLAITALGLELSALYFQYGMDLKPCIMCVYQRTAIWAIFFAGVIGYLAPQQLLIRLIGYGLWGTGAIWGMFLALEHIEMQGSAMSMFFTCEIIPNFPTWAPLHEWLPALFEASGDCGEISWQFLGYSMPQWMLVVFGLYSAAFAIVLLTRIFIAKNL